MLTLTDVTWLYQHLPMRFSLQMSAGERIAILGPSGAGKSTLLSLVAGFLVPANGNIIINGVDHTRTPPSDRPVSMLFQENNLFSHLTVRQNIALGMHPGMKLNEAQKQRLLEIAGTRRDDGDAGSPTVSAFRRPAAACCPGPVPGSSAACSTAG
ncbi:Thiamine import ATP-binding protein ThiQ [Cedecea neteri]|uniref:Thiamine import ATP-binding protein ThiQ n=1 Tax=Cedecea neteri TaxID=158822 RepID=A0A2X2V6A7_9ENTR|nr:Thiamine import ATP-binding protein ThiQ [Cedecea neteri]